MTDEAHALEDHERFNPPNPYAYWMPCLLLLILLMSGAWWSGHLNAWTWGIMSWAGVTGFVAGMWIQKCIIKGYE